MDASSAVQTTLAVLSLLDACIRGFRSIRLSSSFESEYDTCLVRLDVACWNLSTWYKFCCSPELQNDTTCQFLLQEIDRVLENTRKASSIYKKEREEAAKISDTPAQYCGTSSEVRQLRHHIHEQIRATPESSHFGKRVLWVLYRREELDALVNSVTAKIQQLITLFPPQPRDAIDSERVSFVNSIDSSDQLSLLKRASSGTDDSLATAVEAKTAEIQGHSFEGFTVTGYRITVGNEYEGPGSHPKIKVGGNSYKNFKLEGHRSVVGNRFGLGR